MNYLPCRADSQMLGMAVFLNSGGFVCGLQLPTSARFLPNISVNFSSFNEWSVSCHDEGPLRL